MRKKCLTSSATFMQKTLTFKHIFSKKKKKKKDLKEKKNTKQVKYVSKWRQAGP